MTRPVSIQLDAAQVIRLIDGDSGLRSALQGYVCVLPSTLLLDLVLKDDQPNERFSRALDRLTTLWAIDGGMVCNREIASGVELLRSGKTERRDVELSFPFRHTLSRALAERLPGPPPDEWLLDKDFRDFFGNPNARLLMRVVAHQNKVRMDKWIGDIRKATSPDEADETVKDSLLARVQVLCPGDAADLVSSASIDVLNRVFPAFLLGRALRLTYRRDGKTKWIKNDVADLYHAVVAPYCDVFVCDKAMAGRMERAKGLLPFRTHIVKNGQLDDFLRGRPSHRGDLAPA